MAQSLPKVIYISPFNFDFRLLYRQRVFVGALKLVKTSKTAQAGDRIAYLLALAHLLNGVPQSALANNLGEVGMGIEQLLDGLIFKKLTKYSCVNCLV